MLVTLLSASAFNSDEAKQLRWSSKKSVNNKFYGSVDILLCIMLTHSLIHHFETVQNSKKLQTTTEM